jgi:hypothetical protein
LDDAAGRFFATNASTSFDFLLLLLRGRRFANARIKVGENRRKRKETRGEAFGD